MSTEHPPPQPVQLTAADGYRLTALHYPAVGAAQARLFVAGATGVAQRFYAPFANFAASQGIDVWTLDYRGVGLSRPPDRLRTGHRRGAGARTRFPVTAHSGFPAAGVSRIMPP